MPATLVEEIKFEAGEMNSAAMKQHIAKTKTGIIWNHRHITKVEDVPSDHDILEAKAKHIQAVLSRRA